MITLDTFYMRSHIDLAKLTLVRSSPAMLIDYVLHSQDDKAYLKAGTGCGNNTKGHGVVSLSDLRVSANVLPT
jgi:hypothetical protein